MVNSKKQKAKKEHNNIGLDAAPPKEKCSDEKCPWHGSVPLRGRVFVGIVTSSKASKTAIVRWNFLKFIPKYERYMRCNTTVPAYNPLCVSAKAGDKVKIAECRPLSKSKSFVVIEVLK